MISAAAEVQRRLWGTDPRAWAELAESHNRPLFEAVLDAAGVGPGTRLLDVGCGSGLTLVLAAERGAIPAAWTSARACSASPATGSRTPTCAKPTWSRCRSATPPSTR